MNFKKILATLVITISTWFSAGAAQAQLTNYDFSASISTGGSITATFTADLSQVFGPAENAISPFVSVANFTVNGTPAVATYPYSTINGGASYPYFGAVGLNGFSFVGSTMIYQNSTSQYVGLNMVSPAGLGNYSGSGDFNVFNSLADAQAFYSLGQTPPTPIATGTLSNVGWSANGAPEIDGSLAPKVGFLLGCLFLMFGRKKLSPEPLISA